ncbi:unnamed protein product [Linum tenue]|uniref:Uncharacterized protein n=1 Tax=Linum tenue TaxID=586396 RepID=A0AAV0INC2_9ROSI|nr:unnamed protein product [Linum tenue]
MKVVVNIMRLSSLSIAKMSLGTTTTSPVVNRNLAPITESVMGTKEPLLPPQTPAGTRRSQEPWSKPNSYLMEPAGRGKGAAGTTEGKGSVIDGRASDYIRKVHEKNRNDASKLTPLILPPPPSTTIRS